MEPTISDDTKVIVDGKEFTVQELWERNIAKPTSPIPEDIALTIFHALRVAPNGLLRFSDIIAYKERAIAESGKKQRFNPWRLVEEGYITKIPVRKGSKRYVYGMTPKALEYVKTHQKSG